MFTHLFRGVSAAIIIAALVAAGTAEAAPLTCITLTRTLSYNSRGADVSTLQTFLAQDKSLYPEAAVTGFFGRATEKAVQRFQAAHNIVKSGTPATTGYGSVGGKTRAALAVCTGNSSAPVASTSAQTTAPASVVPVSVQTITPVVLTPTNPLVTFTDGATTTITLGAGTPPTITSFVVSPRVVDLTDNVASMQWTSSNALNCNVEKLSGGSYSVVSENVGVNGNTLLPVPENPTVYSLYCKGLGDNSSSSPSSIRRDIPLRIAHPKPSCTVTSDKSSYVYSQDTIKISWISDGADSVSWVHDTSTSDPISLPYGNLYPSGSIFLSSVVGTSQKATLNVKGYGGEATCSASFSVNSATS